MADPRTGSHRLLVYRVRQIPRQVCLLRLIEALNNVLEPGVPVDSVCVRSLCTSLSPLSAVGEQEALVQLDRNKHPSVFLLDDEKIRQLQTSLATPIQIDSQLLGWTVLHEPEEGDIDTCMVFLTGLGAQTFHSWREKGGSYMWPQDYVAQKAPKTLSLSFGYNLKLLQSPSVSTYKEMAQSLMHGVKQHLARFFDKPFAFAAYSLGGLVVKQCLVNMSKEPQYFRRFLVAVRILVFFGVPHKGLENEDFVQVSKGWPNEQGIRELGTGSHHLLELDEAFKQVCRKYKISVLSVYETCLTKSLKTVAGDVSEDGDPVWRVNPESAIHDLSELAQQVPIETYHSLLAKFSRTDNDLDTIMRMVATAAAKFRETWREGSTSDPYQPCEGRVDQIAAIQSFLNVSDSSCDDIQKRKVTVMVICGMNAIGKTFLAEHYFECHEHLYEWNHTVCAATSDKFSASLLHDKKYRRFYSQYHGNSHFPSHFDKHVDSLLAFLDERSSKPWLLLLDDVPSESGSYIEELLQDLRRLRGGHVIVTTRRVNIFAQDRPLKLGPLTRDASRKVLLNAVADNESNSETPAIDGLLNVLGGHPLALRLMGAYKSSEDKSWAEVHQEITRRLAQRKDGSEAGPLAIDSKIDEVFSETWMMAFSAICAVTPQADELLMLWGCFERVGFSHELVRHYKVDSSSSAANIDDEAAFLDAMRVLRDFGLVSRPAQGVYDIHQLPHAACRRSALADEAVAWKGLKCVGAALPSHEHPDYLVTAGYLLPHALAAWDLHQGLVEDPSMVDTEAEAQVSCLLGLLRIFRTQNKIKEGHLVSEYIEKTLNYLPGPRGALPRFELTSEIARLLVEEDHFERAAELYGEVYEGLDHLLGKSDAQTLLAGSDLANTWAELGRTSCAETMLRSIRQECVDKPELADIEYRCWASLLAILCQSRKHEAGVEMYDGSRDLLEFVKEKFPDDSYRIATEGCDLGSICFALGRLEEGKQLFDQYLPDLDRVTPNYVDVYRNKANSAMVHDRLGDYQRAEELYLESLAGYERLARGKRKDEWAKTKLSLAKMYLRQGHRDAAKRLYREAEPMLADGVPASVQEAFDRDGSFGTH